MATNFKEKYGGAALITGASSGLGEVFARKIAERGMDIVLVARNEEKLKSLAAEIKEKYGVNAWPLSVDLTKIDAAVEVKKKTDALGIKVGMLVNNAGFGSHGKFHQLDPVVELQMIDLNIRTPVALTAAYLPAMVANKKGALIFLSSVGAYQPTPYFANYSATKTYNLMFGEALWGELREHNVDCIALSPGYTRTEFQTRAGVSSSPVGGWAAPEKVVERCLNKLGKKSSTIYGFRNWFLAWSIRFTPRRIAILAAGNLSRPS